MAEIRDGVEKIEIMVEKKETIVEKMAITQSAEVITIGAKVENGQGEREVGKTDPTVISHQKENIVGKIGLTALLRPKRADHVVLRHHMLILVKEE